MESDLFTCSICSKSFRHLKHLKRHQSSHGADTGQYQCSTCSKVFTRKDGLQRHSWLHKDTTPSLVTSKSRACDRCVTAKTKCSGSLPCSRCHARRIECRFSATATSTTSMTDSGTETDVRGSSNPSSSARVHSHDFRSSQSANTDVALYRESVKTDLEPTRDPTRTDLALSRGARPAVTIQSGPTTPARDDDRASSQNSYLSRTASATSYSAYEGGDGVLYVDSERARQPVQRKRLMLPPGRSPIISSFSLSFDVRNIPPPLAVKPHVTDDQYRSMRQYFETLCVNSSLMFERFVAPDFPSKEFFCILIDTYFDGFADALPFIHQPTFDGPSRHFALLLALATLGSYFFGHGMDNQFCTSLREFLRRVLWALHDLPAGVRPLTPHEAARIQLLYAVAVRHSTRPFESALQNAVSYCSQSWPTAHKHNDTADVTSKAQWVAWIEREESLRAYFCIWLVDAIFASHAERSPSLKLNMAMDSQLPCTESLWTAENYEAWASSKAYPPAPSLQSTLHSLYVDKQLPPNLGEFARIIAIHGIYHKTCEVREYWQQRLPHFEPSAPSPAPSLALSPAPIWHSSMDVPNRWRNAALDCLDVLHWNANALIGLAHGVEHPTVLHLHFSRIVLLSPLTSIIRLARCTSGAVGDIQICPDADAIKDDLWIVRQWVVQDQYKARLAAIHAGATFWHVRRFSTDAFYEPDTVALATLMLWAISKFLPARQQSENATDNPLIGDDPQIILLDRPIDDELAQQFVREGYDMHVNMAGVGNLFGPHGPQRVLVEGQKLLATIGAWQDGRHRWTNMLSRLDKENRSENSRA